MRLLAVAGVIVAAVWSVQAVAQEAAPGGEPKLVRVIPKDRIPAIFRPSYVSANSASGAVFGAMADSTPVIGLAIEGEARAFAISLLDGHEIVNDTIGGTPVAVTW